MIWCFLVLITVLIKVFMELVIAANIGPLPNAMLAMTAPSAILNTVNYVTGAVTEASKAETVGRI